MITDMISILLIEDTASGYLRCKELTENIGEITWAKTPLQAYDLLEKARNDKNLPRVIILDLSLIDKYTEGLEIIKNLKKNFSNIPVIVWSKHNEEILKKALYLGANLAINKFEDDEDMEQKIINLLK